MELELTAQLKDHEYFPLLYTLCSCYALNTSLVGVILASSVTSCVIMDR